MKTTRKENGWMKFICQNCSFFLFENRIQQTNKRAKLCSATQQINSICDSSPTKNLNLMNNLGVVAVMLVVEFLDVSASTVSKVAMKEGMNDFVFVMYCNAFAALFLLFFCFFLYRKRGLPPLTPWIFAQLFINGCISSSLQMFKFFGVGFSSPTLASAMSDLVPALTFILAIIFRMERLEFGAGGTQFKIFGTLLTFMGALTITLYKGLPLINDHRPWKSFISEVLLSSQLDWIIGASLLAAWSLFLSLMYIVQTNIIKEYPSEPMVILLRSIVVAILSAPVSLISVKDTRAFRLGLNMELVAILSFAVFSLGFESVVHIWVLGKKGPLYVAMFKPLEIMIAIVLGITFLGDTLYLGSVVGAAIIVVGFYAVLWGKAQEEKQKQEGKVCISETSSYVAPLLQNNEIGA